MKSSKDILINNCYKVLCAFENYENGIVSFGNYTRCLNRAIISLSSQEENEVILDAMLLLNGLANMEMRVKHKDVKQVILHITNEIVRKMGEVV